MDHQHGHTADIEFDLILTASTATCPLIVPWRHHVASCYFGSFPANLSSFGKADPHLDCSTKTFANMENVTSAEYLQSISPFPQLFHCIPFVSEINYHTFKGVKKNLLIIYSPPCHPRCSCISFFSRKK